MTTILVGIACYLAGAISGLLVLGLCIAARDADERETPSWGGRP